MSFEELIARVNAKQIGPSSWVLDGSVGDKWIKASEHPILKPLVGAPPAPPANGEVTAAQAIIAVLALVIGVPAMAFGLPYCSSLGQQSTRAEPPAPPAPETRKGTDAWYMAEVFVKRGLKSPGTADFGGLFASDSQKHDCEPAGAKEWLCTGWVDSQNGFGAKVRTNFAVKVRWEGGDQWTATEGPVLRAR